MTRIFTYILLLLSLPAFAANSYNELWWKKGNEHFKAKEYDSAAIYFEKIAALKPADAVVYYNLGNTYYRLNRIGPAVLNYERALKSDPSYKAASDNLLITQSRIANRIPQAEPIFFVKWWRSLTAASTANVWAMLSLLIFLSILGILLAKRMGRLQGGAVQVTIVLSFVWMFALMITLVAASRKTDNTHAVVMFNDIPLLAQPGTAKPLGIVPEGTTVEWVDEKQRWAEVKMPDGRSGYILQEYLGKI